MTGFGRVLGIALFAAVPAVCQQNPDAVRFFEMKIRPLLHNNCVGCHNDQKPTSGLSLESLGGIRNGGNRGPAAIAGKPDESHLIEAVEQSGSLKMPPGGKLKDEQVADLKHWVELGMPWPDEKAAHATAKRKGLNHWAFKAPVRYDPPAVQNASWVRNPIDNFILARLEKEGLKTSPEADRATLIRRLSLDLLGLPPSPARNRRIPCRQAPRRLRAPGGPPAGLSALWRTLGPPLAGCGALRGYQRLRLR